MRHQHDETELWTSYGLIAGGGVGAVLLGFTGSVLWMSFAPGIGLVLGLIIGSLHDQGRRAGPRDGPRRPTPP